jgi:hypothetical protein
MNQPNPNLDEIAALEKKPLKYPIYKERPPSTARAAQRAWDYFAKTGTVRELFYVPKNDDGARQWVAYRGQMGSMNIAGYSSVPLYDSVEAYIPRLERFEAREARYKAREKADNLAKKKALRKKQKRKLAPSPDPSAVVEAAKKKEGKTDGKT